MFLQEGQELQKGKYRIIRILGQGGFGITYLAKHTMLDKFVAIKEFFPDEFCERDNMSNLTIVTHKNFLLIDKLKTRFLKEAKNIAKLDHPSIIKIYDVYEENNTAYYVMEYLEGQDLNEIVRQNGPLSEGKAVEYITKVGEALDYIHSRNMTHFDVKPANIIVRHKDDSPILIDFGLSKQFDRHGDATSTLIPGISYGYSPLEMYSIGENVSFSPQVDIYSLSATLYYLLEGQAPPQATDVIHNPIKFQHPISNHIISEILKGMSLDKNQRHSSIKQFVTSLHEYEKKDDGGDIIMEPYTAPKQGLSKGLLVTIVVALIVMASACVAVFIVVLSDKTSKESTAAIEEKQESTEYNTDIDEEDGNGDAEEEMIAPINEAAIHTTGLTTKDINFDYIAPYAEGFARAIKDGKHGFIDTNGNVIVLPIYDEATGFSNGFARVKKDGKVGFIDRTGEEVIPLIYDVAGTFSEDLSRVKKDGKWGFINRNGNVVIPLIYDYVDFFSGGRAKVKQNGTEFYINKQGVRL